MTDFARRMAKLEALATEERQRRWAQKLAVAFNMTEREALDWLQDSDRDRARHEASGRTFDEYAASVAAECGITVDEIMADAERIKQVLDLV